ncbi:MAG: hypothetical protein J2P35_09815, partial [Actinobacteria bacterium]|nr:hypothetical protein [Actinomycetota bacterium]
QGLRDVTRIAAGDAGLWTQILAANAAPVAEVLAAVAADLSAAAEALTETAQALTEAPGGPVLAGGDDPPRPPRQGMARGDDPPTPPRQVPPGDAVPAAKAITGLLDHGAAGVTRIPGKRGRPARPDSVVQVVIRDQPGELARLFRVAGEAGVNIEDIGIEHSPGLPVGVAELTVRPEAAAALTDALAANGWPVRR